MTLLGTDVPMARVCAPANFAAIADTLYAPRHTRARSSARGRRTIAVIRQHRFRFRRTAL